MARWLLHSVWPAVAMRLQRCPGITLLVQRVSSPPTGCAGRVYRAVVGVLSTAIVSSGAPPPWAARSRDESDLDGDVVGIGLPLFRRPGAGRIPIWIVCSYVGIFDP
jgi:hypothetical protein